MYDDEYLKETLTRAFESEEYFNVPKGIVRYDYDAVHGWWVRVTRDGAQFKLFFNDHKYSSSQESLRAAILYRHEILSSFPVTIKHVAGRTLPLEPEKRINRVEQKRRKVLYIAWRARWYDKDHKVQTKNFSVREYGEETAKRLALEMARKNHNKKPKLSKVPDTYQVQQFKKLERADVAVLASIDSKRPRTAKEQQEIAENDPHAYEGERKHEIHLSIERNRKLREQKIAAFLEKHGSIYCELCGFNFRERYSFLEKDIIEVHHIVPLSQLSASTKTRLVDLVLLCSNCHLAIHQGDAEENLLLAMEQFEAEQAQEEANNGEKR